MDQNHFFIKLTQIGWLLGLTVLYEITPKVTYVLLLNGRISEIVAADYLSSIV